MNVSGEQKCKVSGGTCDSLVEELFKALPPFFDKRVVKYTIVPTEWELPEQSLSRKRRNYHLFEYKNIIHVTHISAITGLLLSLQTTESFPIQ